MQFPNAFMEEKKPDRSEERSETNWEISENCAELSKQGIKVVIRNPSHKTDGQKPNQPTRKSKRKAADNSLCEGVPKKAKMEKEDMKQLIRETIGLSQAQMKNDLSELVAPIKSKLESIEEQTQHLSANCDENTKQIASLTSDIVEMRENIKEELKSELKSELEASQLAAHKINLVREVERTSANIVIHGLPNPTVDTINALIDGMKIDSGVGIEVKRVLSVGKEGKKSCLVTLGDQSQRNAILSKSFPQNLPSKVRIDKDIPRQYRSEYKRMQEEAFKHKCFFNVQCHVAFIGHEMVLRYREKENKEKGFTILRTWFPPPQKHSNTSGNKMEGGPLPSNSIDEDAKLEASRSFLLPDIKDKDVSEVQRLLEEELGPDYVKVREIRISNGRPLIVCESVKSCRDLLASEKIKTKTMVL